MLRFSRCAWLIMLMLTATSATASAESSACYPFRSGDTASRLAKRMTGRASNEYQPWFNIVDLLGRSVPKSQYNRVRSGWRACVVERTVEGRLPEAGRVVTAEVATHVESAATPRSASAPRIPEDVFRPGVLALLSSLTVDPAPLWLGAGVVVPAVGFIVLGGYVRRRNASRIFMRQFAYLFVREFERPLLRDAAAPAMKARLRISAYQARMEICLAPGIGRRYPNLSDHRKNVEYDVHRVLSALGDESFVCGRLRMREGWVVVPFRFSARLKQRGVRWISSL